MQVQIYKIPHFFARLFSFLYILPLIGKAFEGGDQYG